MADPVGYRRFKSNDEIPVWGQSPVVTQMPEVTPRPDSFSSAALPSDTRGLNEQEGE